jgi:hypothetical protein
MINKDPYPFIVTNQTVIGVRYLTNFVLILQQMIHMYRNGFLNLLKPTGQVMHHQFNIQQLYALPTLYLCVLYLSENKQRLVPLTA